MDKENILERAANFLAEKDYEAAINEYEKVLAVDEQNSETLKALGLCYFNMQNNHKAFEYLQKANKINQEDATVLYYLASLSALNNNLELSTQYAKQVIELRPDYYDAYKILFSNYIKAKKLNDILILYKEFSERSIEVTDGTVFAIMGSSYMMQEKFAEAIDFLLKALDYEPNKIQFYNNIGVCYMALKRYDEALEYLEKSLAISPDNMLAYTDMGTIYQLKGEFLRALECFNKALELAPDDFMNLLNVANMSSLLKRYDLAINAYEKLLNNNPDLKDIQTSLIGAYMKSGQHEKAINLIDKALEKSNRNVPLLFKKAKIYTEVGDFTAAQRVYDQILSFKKNSPTIYHAYAILYTKMNDLDKAIHYLNKSLTIEDNNAQAHKDLGVIYLMRNQIEFAKEEFDKAILLGQSDNEILKECADFYYSISDFTKADELYRKSLALENNPYTTLALGINLIGLNKLEEAFAVLEKLLSVLPDEPELLYNLSRILYAQNDCEKAANLAHKAYLLAPTVEIANLLALCLKQLGKYEEAANIFDKIIFQYPYNSFVYDDLTECYKKINDKNGLRRTYEAAIKYLAYEEDRIIEYAKLLVEINDKETALKELNKANFENPSQKLKDLIEQYK